MKQLGPLAGSPETLCAVLLVTRADGTVLGYTDHDAPLTLASNTYTPAPGVLGIKVTITNNAQVGTVRARSAWVPAITEADLVAGLYDNATIQIGLANWKQPSLGVFWLFGGLLGIVNATADGFQADAQSALWVLQRALGVFATTNCRHVLGSTVDPAGVGGCLLNLAPYTYTGTIQSVTNAMTWIVDVANWNASATPNTPNAPSLAVTQNITGQFLAPGTYSYSVSAIDANGQESATSPIASANVQQNNGGSGGGEIALTWGAVAGAVSYNVYGNTAQQLLANVTGTSWTDNGSGAQGGSPPLFGDYFAQGILTMTSGAANGFSTNVRTLQVNGGVQTLFPLLPLGVTPAAGDTFTITAGCAKTAGACQYKFKNIINFGGFADLVPMREWG